MTTVSIIIVNYNVRDFVLQCLDSVFQSNLSSCNLDVWVVDNNSVDGSVEAISKKFPSVHIIANKENFGFGKANNQVISITESDYCLLLNPDTIIEENTIQHCIMIMQQNERLGALGVKMVDGAGNYLKESKRSLPSLFGSLTKLLKLSDVFPKSKWLNKYYTEDTLGTEFEDVEVLCGAFMFCRTRVLHELKGFDEDFFLYGEDIDLCKRILDAGWKIQYTPETKIIHFKGESSKKTSLSYLHSFYNSMLIYLDKHYNSSMGRLTNFLVKIAVYAFGIVRGLKEYLRILIWPLIDFLVVFFSLGLLKNLWGEFYFGVRGYYDDDIFRVNQSIYSLVWISNLWFWGWYDGKRKFKSLFYGLIIGTLLLLAIYALQPMEYRTSRSLLLMGSVITFLIVILTNKFRNFFSFYLRKPSDKRKNIIIVGYKESIPKLVGQLNKSEIEYTLQGVVSPDINYNDVYYLNSIDKLNDLVRRYKSDEIIFVHQDISSNQIIDLMTISDVEVSYKIAGSSDQILGSQYQSTSGEIYDTYTAHHLSRKIYKRLKRTIDIIVGLMFIVCLPAFIFNYKTRRLAFNAIALILGYKTLITYSSDLPHHNLPSIKPGLIELDPQKAPKEYLRFIDDNINHWYSLTYSPFIDFEILKNYIFRL